MSRRAVGAVAVAVAAGTALLVATDIWPGVRGPASWRWGYRPLDSFAPLLGVVGLQALAFLGAVRVRRTWAAGRNRVRVPLLAGLVLLVLLQMGALTAMEPGGLANVPRRVMDPSFTSYHTVARQVEDVGRFLRRYDEIQGTFPVHGPSQPPGRILFFRAVNRWAEAPARTETLLALGERLGGVPSGPPGTTDGQRAGALAAGWLLMALGALALVPLVVILGGRCAPGAVGAATLGMAGLPAFLLFTPQTDHLVLLLALVAAACKIEAMRYASGRRAPLLAFGAGLAAGLGVFVSFTEIAAVGAWGLGLLGMIALGVRRADPFPTAPQIGRIALGALLGLLVVPSLAAAAGLDWPAVFAQARHHAHAIQTVRFGRTYGEWVVRNLSDFALFAGPGLVVAWLARLPAEVRALGPGHGFVDAGADGRTRLPLEIPFALAGLVAVLVLDLSGTILGETGRIWMFLMPLAVAAWASSTEGRPDRELVPVAVAQLLVLLALRGWVNVPG